MKLIKYLPLLVLFFTSTLLQGQIDVGIDAISSPANTSTVNPSLTVIVFDIKNYGTNTLPINNADTVQIEVLINGTLEESYFRPPNTPDLASGGSETWNINFDFGAYGITPGSTFNFCMRTSLKGDPNSSNDQTCVSYTLATSGPDLGIANGTVLIGDPTGLAPGSNIAVGTQLNQLTFDLQNFGTTTVSAGTPVTIDLTIGSATAVPLSGTLGSALAPGGTTTFTIDCTPAGIDESFPTTPGLFQICVETTTSNDPNNSNNKACSGWTMTSGGGGLPTITSISPNAGPVGSSVTIYGTNFSSTSLDVYFSPGLPATVTKNTPTELVVTVPAGAQTGSILVISGGNSVNSSTFTVTTNPIHEITSISPNAGQVGSQVTITGTGFSTTASAHTVTFEGGAQANVNSANATQLVVTVPAAAQTGRIEVLLNGFSALSPDTFTITTGPVPTITDFNPKSGAPGMEVTIVGTNFDPVTTNNVVSFNGANATVKSGNTSQLIVEVPTGASTGKISLTAGGVTVNSAVDFTIVTTPIIVDFDPKSGPVETTVTIQGFNFSPIATNNIVYFGTAQAGTPVASADGKTLIVDVPFNAKSGAQTVSVEVGGFTEISNKTFSVDALSVDEVKGLKIDKVYYYNNQIVLDMQNAQSLNNLSVEVFTLNGKMIVSEPLNEGQRVQQSLSLNLANGTYIVSVSENGQAMLAKKIVVAQ